MHEARALLTIQVDLLAAADHTCSIKDQSGASAALCASYRDSSSEATSKGAAHRHLTCIRTFAPSSHALILLIAWGEERRRLQNRRRLGTVPLIDTVNVLLPCSCYRTEMMLFLTLLAAEACRSSSHAIAVASSSCTLKR